MNNVELSIIMPCLNESETLASCIKKAKTFLDNNGISGEIIVADNGSTDSSRDIPGTRRKISRHSFERLWRSAYGRYPISIWELCNYGRC